MLLITTADQRFWKTGEKVLFLGNWCKVYDQENVWSALDHEVLPYHWDDRSRLFEDYKYLDELYERVLTDLASELNKLHNIKYSARYWRIVVGPWLHHFLQNFYDRYLSITAVIESGNKVSTLLPDNLEWVVPDDFYCFSNWLRNHRYNLFLYSRLIADLNGLDLKKTNIPLNLNNPKVDTKSVKNSLLKVTGYLSQMVPDFLNEIVFVASYIKPKDLFWLQVSLGQMPYFCVNEIAKPKSLKVNESMRNRIQIRKGLNQFESILPDWISHQIPKVYVEGYSNLVHIAKKKYPKKPKVIVTSNSLFGNEGFKVWAGENIEKGVKLVGTQHGGEYGMALWSASETHETKVVDKYFSWGWENSNDQTIVPLTSARLCWGKSKIKTNPTGRILWIGFCEPPYSNCSYSSPIGPQFLNYIADQKKFLEETCPSARKLLLLRLYPRELGWHENHMWQQVDSSLEVYRGPKSNFDQLNESRLAIGTYNGMGILETLSANYPTVIFWDPNHWELRKTAKPVFDALLDVGIFHETPRSAASKVNEVYQDVQSWWILPEVQSARNKFCSQFARADNDWPAKWKEQLLKLSLEKEAI
jgi:putative transferase (TIGR04331 family)